MAWDDEMPELIRSILQDEGDSPSYNDAGLLRVILASAMKLLVQIRFAHSYAIDFENQTITPDPTEPASRDDWFVILTCHQAVVSLVKSEIRLMTRQGITIQDGDSKISLQRSAESLKAMLAAYEDELRRLIRDYETGAANGGPGEAIVTPYPYFGDLPFPARNRGIGG